MLSFPLIESLTIQTTVDFSKNRILRDDKGREQRIIPHQAPLRKYNLTKKILTTNDVNTLYSLFESMKGAGDSFLYQDKSDYRATHLANTFSAGVYTQGVVIQYGANYLLCKKYACGNNIHYRPIYHADTLTIYSGNTVVTGWTFFDGGTITGLSGDGYTANFTFKTPVGFEVDKLENVISTSKNSSDHLLYSLNNVILSETRQSIPIILTDTFLDDCGHTFQIDFLFNSTRSKNYTTEIIPLASGYEKRTSLQDDGITEIDFGDRTQLTQDHLEYLLCVWLNTKGCGAFFNFEDETNTSVGARFDNLPLTYTQRSPLPHPKYEVKGLRARLFYEGILEDTGYNGWVGSVLTLCDCIKIDVPLTYVFGTYLSTGGPYSSNAGGYYFCNGGCNVYFRWRTIEGIPLFSQAESSIEVINGIYYLVFNERPYMIDFIYSWSYISRDTGSYRGYPEGPFSPHGIGLQYNPLSNGCIQSNSLSPAYGESPVIDFTVTG